jgi:hypothetical protein
MRGRYPSGPEFVAKLEGSAEAKERLQVLLETLAGGCRVGEACDRLGIKEARFDQLRIEALQAAVLALEAKPAGRKPQPATTDEGEVQLLRGRLAELEAELQTALVRAQVGVVLPRVGEQKKTTTTSPRQRRRRVRARKKRS